MKALRRGLPVRADLGFHRPDLIDTLLCALAAGCGTLGYWLYGSLVTTMVY